MKTLGNRWWILLAAYPAFGLVAGLADPLLGRLAVQLDLRRGMATAASVNLSLPLLAVILATRHRRVAAAWIGAVLMTLGLIAGLAGQYPGSVRDWSPLGVLAAVPPVLVLACVGYAVVGTIAAFVAGAFHGPKPAAKPHEPE